MLQYAHHAIRQTAIAVLRTPVLVTADGVVVIVRLLCVALLVNREYAPVITLALATMDGVRSTIR